MLRPNGLLFIEPSIYTGAGSKLSAAQQVQFSSVHAAHFCMEQLPVSAWPHFVAETASGGHHNYLGQLRCFRRLPLAACGAFRAGRAAPACRLLQRGVGVEACLTNDTEPTEPKEVVRFSAHSRAAYEQLVDAMTPWLEFPKTAMQRLIADDEHEARVSVLPVRLDVRKYPVTIRRYPTATPNARVMTVLVAHAPSGVLARVLRSRAMQFWGMAANGVHVMSVAAHAHSPAPAGAIVHDMCSRPLPVHPRAFDIIVLHDALSHAEKCTQWQEAHESSKRDGDGANDSDSRRSSVLLHLLLELKRVSRPGPLGLIVLTGDENLERRVRANLTEEVRRVLRTVLNASWLGCMPPREGLAACAARVGVSSSNSSLVQVSRAGST